MLLLTAGGRSAGPKRKETAMDIYHTKQRQPFKTPHDNPGDKIIYVNFSAPKRHRARCFKRPALLRINPRPLPCFLNDYEGFRNQADTNPAFAADLSRFGIKAADLCASVSILTNAAFRTGTRVEALQRVSDLASETVWGPVCAGNANYSDSLRPEVLRTLLFIARFQAGHPADKLAVLHRHVSAALERSRAAG
jgi:hypothetical protein